MEAGRCPICGASTVIPGRVARPVDMGLVASDSNVFVPAHTQDTIKLRLAFRSCWTCGHVWCGVEPDQLRAAIERHGKELAKQLLKSAARGPYHDVPDIPEARTAADRVAEIDELVWTGNHLALRRYHELTKYTWDEVHATIPGWADLTRARKLALFGWCPKGKGLDDDPNPNKHPMHDPLLDG